MNNIYEMYLTDKDFKKYVDQFCVENKETIVGAFKNSRVVDLYKKLIQLDRKFLFMHSN